MSRRQFREQALRWELGQDMSGGNDSVPDRTRRAYDAPSRVSKGRSDGVCLRCLRSLLKRRRNFLAGGGHQRYRYRYRYDTAKTTKTPKPLWGPPSARATAEAQSLQSLQSCWGAPERLGRRRSPKPPKPPKLLGGPRALGPPQRPKASKASKAAGGPPSASAAAWCIFWF